jgi:hypothetical protein
LTASLEILKLGNYSQYCDLDYGLDNLASVLWAEERDLYLFHNIQTLRGTHPPSSSMGAKGFFLRVKTIYLLLVPRFRLSVKI